MLLAVSELVNDVNLSFSFYTKCSQKPTKNITDLQQLKYVNEATVRHHGNTELQFTYSDGKF